MVMLAVLEVGFGRGNEWPATRPCNMNNLLKRKEL